MSIKQNVFLRGHRAHRFEALQHCLVPLSQSFNDDQRRQSRQLINHLLQDKPTSIRLRLALFLRVIDLVSLLTGCRTFKNLSLQRQEKALNFFFDSRIGLLRKGFWGLNTLAKLSVYGQASVYPKIHYHLREIPDE